MNSEDKTEIEALLAQMLSNLCWDPDNPPDMEGFISCFVEGARLFPAARPVTPVEIPAFAERMKTARESGGLDYFLEEPVKDNIQVFGNTAVALSSFRSVENRGSPSMGVNAVLLVKDAGTWQIASMAWGKESSDHPVPADLR